MQKSRVLLLSHLRLWLPVVLCYGVILFLSLAHVPVPSIKPFPYADKVVHFLEFIVLGVFLGSAVLRERHYQKLTTKTRRYLFVLVLILAALGELLQFLTLSRTPEIADFIANLLGCFVGLSSYFFETGLILSRKGEKSYYIKFAQYNFLKRVYFWLPPLAIFALISFYSHQTPQVLYTKHLPLPQDILPDTGSLNLFKNLWIFHVVQFGPLGFFIARALAWEASWSQAKNRKWILFGGILLITFLSYIDEWHQGLIPGRVNEIWDMVFNFVGCGLGMLVYWKGYLYIKNRFI